MTVPAVDSYINCQISGSSKWVVSIGHPPCSVSFSVLDGENEFSNARFGKYSFNVYRIAQIFQLYFQLSIKSIVVHGLKQFYNVSIEYDFTFYVMNNKKICNYDSLNCLPNCVLSPQTSCKSCKSYTKHSFVVYNTIYMVQLICNFFVVGLHVKFQRRFSFVC